MRIVSRAQARFCAAVAVCLAGAVACSSSDGGTGSSAPEIVGCNSVLYRGVTYGNLGCAPGIASFTVSGSQNGNSFCFNITCSAGCVSGVTVCSSAQLRVLRDETGQPIGIDRIDRTDRVVRSYERSVR